MSERGPLWDLIEEIDTRGDEAYDIDRAFEEHARLLVEDEDDVIDLDKAWNR